MSNKTVVVILVTAAALVAFIFFFERDTMTTSERKARHGRVFSDFKKDHVTMLTLKGVSGQEIVVEKLPTLGEAEDTWRITSPKILDADTSEVREALSALDFLLIDRAVKGADKVNDPAFALTSPRIEGRVAIRDKTIGFKVGADAQGEKVYFSVTSAPNEVYAVNNDIVDTLDKTLDDLRSKKLVKQKLENVTSASLSRPIGLVSFRKEGEMWQVAVGENWIEAAADQAKSLIRLVAELEAVRFVVDDVQSADLVKFGLDKPTVTMRAKTEKGISVGILVGNDCDGKKGEKYVMVEGSETVACTKDNFSIIAEQPFIRFEETRPVVVSHDEVVGITITRENETLAMSFKDDSWVNANGVGLDADVITETLKLLTEARATQIDVGDPAVNQLKGEKTTVTLALADDDDVKTLLFVNSGDRVQLRRGEEKAVLTVPPHLVEKLTPDLLTYRSRRLRDESVSSVEKLVISGPVDQTLQKKGGTWQITAPIAIAADSGAVRKLAELVATLKADKFVSPKPLPTHGFSKPFATIEATLHAHDHVADTENAPDPADNMIVIDIGAQNNEGKRFARVRGSDQTVFLITDEFEYAMRNPLIARDALQIDETEVTGLTIDGQNGSKVFKKENDIWRAEPEAPIDEAMLKRLLADIGGVKAISATAFGPGGKPFDPAYLTLTFQTDNGGVILNIGQRSSAENTDGYLARKAGVDATFVVPKRLVEDIDKMLNPEKGSAPPKK